MAFNEAKFNAKMQGAGYDERVKTAYKSNTFAKVCRLSSMADGTYPFRILPEMVEKCPDGCYVDSIHEIQQEIGKEAIKVACIAENGDKDTCPADITLVDLVDAVAEKRLPSHILKIIGGNPMNNWGKSGGKSEKKQPALCEYNLAARTVVAWPVIIEAEPPDEGSKWARSRTERVAILEIQAEGVNEALVEKIRTIPYLTDPTHGRYITVTKNKSHYDLIVGDVCPLRNPGLYTLAGYPHIVKLYTSNTLQYDYDAMWAFIESCWWYRDPHVQAELKRIRETADQAAQMAQTVSGGAPPWNPGPNGYTIQAPPGIVAPGGLPGQITTIQGAPPGFIQASQFQFGQYGR